MKQALRPTPTRDPRRIAVIFSVTCIVVLVINATWLIKNHGIYAGVLVVCSVIGGLLGWTVAVLATPSSEAETLKFNAYAKVVSGFLSGYLFTKLNDVFDSKTLNVFLRQSENAAQLGYAVAYGAAFFLIGLMWTFLVRRYTQASFLDPVDDAVDARSALPDLID